MAKVSAAKLAVKMQQQQQQQQQQLLRHQELRTEKDVEPDVSAASGESLFRIEPRIEPAVGTFGGGEMHPKSAVPFWDFGSLGASAAGPKRRKKNGKSSAKRDANLIERLDNQPKGRRRSLKAMERRKKRVKRKKKEAEIRKKKRKAKKKERREKKKKERKEKK